ncbi:MAG: 2-hydroxycyclohexanecarboxyl-CoA dehydrogenase [Acidimicrobiaceae bacterium]|jgi:NAD(P)-dependent dehydrogenase (short-subunit alcohol dehydrogenase family)|nr:2-hydroxycyclohexanecarboxyl-CoA dehydrogenase [Acidimicrobiaceae bacterium]
MARQPFELQGALVLITGAGSGIGKASALAFADAGAPVVAVDLDEAAAEKTAAEVAERGVKAAAFGCDVSDWEAVSELAKRVAAEQGPLDVLVNNAGVGMSGRFDAMSIDDWRWIRSVNLDGVVHGCRAFGPSLVARGRGHVVNLSSGLGYTPTATEPAYVTTKAAVLALSQCLRADWRASGVGVSAICPGVINTPIIDKTRFLGEQATSDRVTKAKKAFRRGHPPERVAAAIVEAVRWNRAVVPVGFEAKLGWWLHRYAPIAVQQVVARAAAR